MFDDDDDVKVGFRRFEVATRSVSRRRWSAAERAVIVAESDVAGVRVSDVARRWQLRPQQLYQWRHVARAETTGGLIPRVMRDFVPIVTDPVPPALTSRVGPATPVIEVKLAGAVVRVVSGVDDAQLTAVLRAVGASAARS